MDKDNRWNRGDSTNGSPPPRRRGRTPPRRDGYDSRRDKRSRSPRRQSDSSTKICRVFVGNLSYDTKWHHLKDFMREAGDVVFADIISLPNGQSKGCGLVEYRRSEDAERAIRTLSESELMGRKIFIREDREDDTRFSQNSGPSRSSFDRSRGDHYDGRGVRERERDRDRDRERDHDRDRERDHDRDRDRDRGRDRDRDHDRDRDDRRDAGGEGRQIYVGNLPYSVTWRDLKDLLRAAGRIVRADVFMGQDGRPKGCGMALFDTASDAQNAITMFDGYDMQGRKLEVKIDRYASGAPPPRFTRDEGSQNAPRTNGTGSVQPTQQIFIKNLPFVTTNQDLVELFSTTGAVEKAEMLVDNGKVLGTAVVQMDSVESAEVSIARLNGHVYGGRSLNISYKLKPHEFDVSAATGSTS